MAQTGVTVRRTGGQPLPEEYLKLVLEQYPTAWGAAVVDGEEFLVNGGEGPIDVAFIRETENKFPDSDITFHFVNSEGALNLDDVPPYVLVEDDEQRPLVVGFFDGNFPSFAKTDSSHPAEWWLSEQLREKFAGMLESFDGDIEKLMAAIEKPYFRKEMALNAVSRGYITILAYDGKSVTYAQGDTHSEGEPWGWTSNLLGFGKKEESKEVTAEAPSAFPKRSANRSTVREKMGSASEAIPSASVSTTQTAELTARQAALAKQYIVKKGKPEDHLSRQQRAQWFNNRLGYKPTLWESKTCVVEFYVNPKGELIPWNVIKKLGMDMLLLPKLNNPPRTSDTGTENIPETPSLVPQKDDKAVERLVPILAPPAREAMKKYMSDEKVKKKIAENAAIVEDPQVVQQLEAKFADFASQLGMKDMSDFMRYDFSMFFDVAQMRPDVSALMNWTFRNMLAPHWIAKKKHEKEEAAQTETHVLAKDELKPSAFPKRTAKKAVG